MAPGAHGDLLAAVATGLVGGRALVPTVDLGEGVALFGVAHGQTTRLASLGVANPTALLLSAVHLLRQLGEGDLAETVEHAVALTLDQGIRTPDVPGHGTPVGTSTFADAVVSNLGRRLPGWHSRARNPVRLPSRVLRPEPETVRRVVGLDVLVVADAPPEQLAARLVWATDGTRLHLSALLDRGAPYPAAGCSLESGGCLRARFLVRDAAGEAPESDFLLVLARVAEHARWVRAEKLAEVDGAPAFTPA